MNWYLLISRHKSASRAMISECLMILDHLSIEVEISKLQTQFTSFLEVFKIIEHLEI